MSQEKNSPVQGEENNTPPAKGAQKTIPLKGRAKAYFRINRFIAVLASLIAGVAVLEMACGSTDSEEEWGLRAMLSLSLVGFIIFVSRCFWMRRVSKYGYQVTDNPDDYALERTALLAWVLLFTFAVIEAIWHTNLERMGLKTVGGWIFALAFWAPIVNVVGAGWGKLKATKPNEGNIIWPCNWGNEGGEEKKGWWAKLKKTVDKPAYGNIALVIIQILLYAMTSAATLEQEWFIEVKFIVLIPILFVWAICTVIYCVACKGSMIAFFCLFALVFLSFVLAVVGISGLKDPVTYGLQLGLQSASLIFAVFASKERCCCKVGAVERPA